jgi:hypothetical protein
MFSVGRLKARLQAFLAEATRSGSIGLRGPSQLTIALLAKIGLVLAIATILVGLAFWTWTDFAETRDAAVDKGSAIALVIEEHAQRSLLAVDVVLGRVRGVHGVMSVFGRTQGQLKSLPVRLRDDTGCMTIVTDQTVAAQRGGSLRVNMIQPIVKSSQKALRKRLTEPATIPTYRNASEKSNSERANSPTS